MLRSTLLLLTLFTAPLVHGTYQHNATHPASNFTYTGETGPLAWASLSPANRACSTSKHQSPINLSPSNATGITFAKSRPNVSIPDVERADLENLGSTLQVFVNGTTSFEGKQYKLAQFHFHTPSEHRIEEEYFPLEAHFVHQAAAGARLVLAVLFELTPDGNTTQLLTSVTRNISAVALPGSLAHTGPLHFQPLLAHFHSAPLYRYEGSLTTPPCSEGVTWLVARDPLPLDVKTWLAFKKVMRFNARYTQNTPGRENLIEVAAREVRRQRRG
ncbi:putative carbonic anhydrase [Lyophyllum shimeji]|uniref:Carbonic anhydrase n=1 Tax=Lyophyllum shimeji TaxID=47721 RepID=A0A9P3PPN2_LYOSH|nr:putative carbonic anhydrase [Lyophyllum shimeji]